MECYYHPNKEGVNTCAICGKSVCDECSLEIAGKMYCKECLEKIVGIGLNNKTDEKKETQNTASEEITERPEPVRLGKKEEPNIYQEPQDIYEESIYQSPKEEKAIFASDLSSNLDQNNESIYASDLQKESQVYNNSPQQDYYPEEEVSKAIAEDSPYNIKGMDYSKEINETPKSYFKKESAPYLEPSNNINQDQSMGQNIVENQQQTLRQQPQSAQNEFDYYPQEQIAPQQQAPHDYIYPDHTYEPEETSARKALEEKYERYLDDLYFDETEVPLEEQLAKDEAEYGSLTKKPYVPPTSQPIEEYTPQTMEEPAYAPQQIGEQTHIPQANEKEMYGQQQSYYQQEPQIRQPRRSYEEEQELDRQIREQLNIRREQPKKSKKPIHNIRYEDEKESFGIVDIILTIILIIAIIIVLFYIVYLLFLTSSYPTFLDAIFGLQDPGELIGNLMK